MTLTPETPAWSQLRRSNKWRVKTKAPRPSAECRSPTVGIRPPLAQSSSAGTRTNSDRSRAVGRNSSHSGRAEARDQPGAITLHQKERVTMKVTIEKNELVIRMPAAKNPSPSKSGKTLVVSSSGGFADAKLNFNGKPLKIAVLAT